MNSTYQYLGCIDACNACITACNACIAECLKEQDVSPMAGCIAMNMDCAAVCALASGAMARNSEMAKHFCKLCGEICLACANECEQHLREHTRRCAIDCHACAKECHALIN
ncbi:MULTISPECIES: four-helix bundle copper-binding protein [Comamonas]|uniref:Domain of Uncharacterized Function (DUF326) n=1 Tax=Comamonas testosteroni TaxID=285 RepID=A0A8B4S041_COMTE|nr:MULTISPECIES: four-helix bundle copper-binding protein [Comamonas]EFI62666.1 hypothetical protein CTS44_06293 [Comamonas thiooxydans]EHN65095.1 hypothetical protein CTATCC11996_14878 [Comamonas testosteroni ATCC 11996]RDI10996.1 hypothetical protein DFO48_105512 [Comamonas sp. AG1104]TFF55623.1 four-helix bundle copper-binding protein [Comamonas sp. A23]SUY77097.1 Domain of Uncharacterised Function (DUF326) [Comamonas testosteroni]